nr:MAG TPA: FAD binding domain [Bacteriophage sp.]
MNFYEMLPFLRNYYYSIHSSPTPLPLEPLSLWTGL